MSEKRYGEKRYGWISAEAVRSGVLTTHYHLKSGEAVEVTSVTSSQNDSGTTWSDSVCVGELDMLRRMMTTFFQKMADCFPGKLELLEEGDREGEDCPQRFIHLRAHGKSKSDEFFVISSLYSGIGTAMVTVSHDIVSNPRYQMKNIPDVVVSALPYYVLLVACGDLSSWEC
jgi:hypothetical protein